MDNLSEESQPILGRAYVYKPLADPAIDIRLLQILPGSDNADIQLKISVWPLNDAPNYRAISYTWGAKGQSIVFIDSCIFPVTRNCRYTLWQARLHYPSDYVWIDSICINQKDNAEKGKQVQMMGDIYQHASMVLASVGPHYSYTECLEEVSTALQANRCFYEDWDDTSSEGNKFDDFILSSPCLAGDKADYFHLAVNAIQKRPYWTRLWIVQELVAGQKSGIRILCGNHSIYSDSLQLLILLQDYLYYQHNQLLSSWQEEPEASQYIETIFRRNESDKISIHEFPNWMHSGCVDPRDRLYGLLSFIDWSRSSNTTPILPDYNISAFELGIQLCSYLNFSDLGKALQALEVLYNHPDMQHVVSQRSRSAIERTRLENTYDISSRVTIKLGSYITCYFINEDESGDLTASLYKDDYRTSMVAQGPISLAHAIDKLGMSVCSEPRPQLLKVDSEVAALLCSEARPGDVMIPIQGFDTRWCSLLILRHNCDDQYDIVGQGFITATFDIASYTDFYQDAKDREDAKPIDCAFLADITLSLLPEEWLLLAGQDMRQDEDDPSRKWAVDAQARVQRLVTLPALFSHSAARLEEVWVDDDEIEYCDSSDAEATLSSAESQ